MRDVRVHRILVQCVGTEDRDDYKPQIWGAPSLTGHTVGVPSGKKIP